MNERYNISIQIALNFVPNGPTDNKSVLVQVMAWHRTGNMPLPEPMLTQFTDIRGRRVKASAYKPLPDPMLTQIYITIWGQ